MDQRFARVITALNTAVKLSKEDPVNAIEFMNKNPSYFPGVSKRLKEYEETHGISLKEQEAKEHKTRKMDIPLFIPLNTKTKDQ